MQQTADTTTRTTKRINADRVPQRSSIAMVSIATKVSAVCIFSPLMHTAGEVAFRISISRILIKTDGFIQTTYFCKYLYYLFLYCSALIFKCTGCFRLIFSVSISFFELLFYVFYVFSKTFVL